MLGVRRPMREESLGYGVDKLYIRGLAKVLAIGTPTAQDSCFMHCHDTFIWFYTQGR